VPGHSCDYCNPCRDSGGQYWSRVCHYRLCRRVGIPLFIFTLAGNWLFTKSRALSGYTGRIQQLFGIVMIVMALLIATNYDKVLQAKLLDAFPSILISW